MNCSFNGEFHIEVLSGGEFYIFDHDNDNTTTEDASVITSNTAYCYLFYVRDNATMIMKNSELHECGWDSSNKGLCIYSDNVVVEHSLISYNYYGIYADGSSATISNNTITKTICFHPPCCFSIHWNLHFIALFIESKSGHQGIWILMIGSMKTG